MSPEPDQAARVVGTAGHVDHGKTALVMALTGADTDRLPEERARGISIDLGFAPLDLGPGAPPASVVDVPGHEDFIRNMVAGATGIDAVLFTVAADEGMMPQSLEHLIVLEALGIERGVVAVTKSDLVEPAWTEMVMETVAEALSGTVLAGATIMAVSARTGEGIEALRTALAAVLDEAPARSGGLPFRMPVDRAFGVPGVGTVVTGTVWSGTAVEGGELIAFARRRAGLAGRAVARRMDLRVRSIEVHGRRVALASSGQRAALGLSGGEASVVTRGAVLVTAGSPWRPAARIEADCWLASSAPRAVERGARVRLHHGTSEVMARIDWQGQERVEPGGRGAALLRLEAPIVPAAGDRFVLRAYSPVQTIGGGTVLIREPPRVSGRARADRGRWLAALAGAGPAERLQRVLESSGGKGIADGALPLDSGLAGPALDGARAAAGPAIRRLAGRWFARSVEEGVKVRLLECLADFHRREPLQPGMPLEAARQTLRPGAPELIESAISDLIDAGRLERRGTTVALAGRAAALDPALKAAALGIRSAYRAAGLEAPQTEDLVERLAIEPARLRALQAYLEREGELVKLASDWYADREAVEGARTAIVAHIVEAGHADTGACKEILGVSRKYLIPILEYLDRSGTTRREGNHRVLGKPVA